MKGKRLSAWFMALVMMICLLPAFPLAASAEERVVTVSTAEDFVRNVQTPNTHVKVSGLVTVTPGNVTATEGALRIADGVTIEGTGVTGFDTGIELKGVPVQIVGPAPSTT